jgi:cation transporter-like permease
LIESNTNRIRKKEKTSTLTKACPLVIGILLLAISYLYLYIYAHSVTHFAGGGWCGVASTLGIHFFVMALRLVSSNRASAALEDFSKSA